MPDRKEKEKKPLETLDEDFLASDITKKSKEVAGEVSYETLITSEQAAEKEAQEKSNQKITISQVQSPVAPVMTKEEVEAIKEIENVLSENLEDIYLQLSPMARQEFKIKGEETAKKIHILLQKAKIKVREILQLIKTWLKTIPGVSKFFLEQEAKIKTEKIIRLGQK